MKDWTGRLGPRNGETDDAWIRRDEAREGADVQDDLLLGSVGKMGTCRCWCEGLGTTGREALDEPKHRSGRYWIHLGEFVWHVLRPCDRSEL